MSHGTRKIFVGGLASHQAEGDVQNYFQQYGPIAEVLVMRDMATQRPRGFGFVTFESEDAVGRVMVSRFHSLDGKQVEGGRGFGGPQQAYGGPQVGFGGAPYGAYGEQQQPMMDAGMGMPGPPGAGGPPQHGWTVHTAPDGTLYYYNEFTGVSQWERPKELM
eukprot:PRCOL_00002667-RA